MGHRYALGTMNFGKRTPEAEARKIIDRALERGITVLDTANAYVDGESERIVGRAVKGRRERVEIATKVGFGRRDGKFEGLSRPRVLAAIDESLARLDTDYVDIYYLHVPDHATPIEETLDTVAELLQRGRVKRWGVSNYASWQILEMMHLADERKMARPFIAQQLYNLLIRQLDVEYFAFAKKFGVHTTVYNPLAGGLLAGKHTREAASQKGSRFDGNRLYLGRYWSDVMFDHVEGLKVIANEAGLSLVDLAYAWVLGRPGVDSVLVGPGTLEHLDAALAALEKSVDDETRKKIDALFRHVTGTESNYVR